MVGLAVLAVVGRWMLVRLQGIRCRAATTQAPELYQELQRELQREQDMVSTVLPHSPPPSHTPGPLATVYGDTPRSHAFLHLITLSSLQREQHAVSIVTRLPHLSDPSCC